MLNTLNQGHNPYRIVIITSMELTIHTGGMILVPLMSIGDLAPGLHVTFFSLFLHLSHLCSPQSCNAMLVSRPLDLCRALLPTHITLQGQRLRL